MVQVVAELFLNVLAEAFTHGWRERSAVGKTVVVLGMAALVGFAWFVLWPWADFI